MRKNEFGIELKEFINYKNMSIKEFAYRIGTTSKNLIDILNGDVELSPNMIYNISFVTDIPVNYIEKVEHYYKLDINIDSFLNKNNISIKEYLKRFNIKELKESYNVIYTNEKNDYSILKNIMNYLRINDLDCMYKENNSILYKSKNDKTELLMLWLERCYKLACEQEVINNYNKSNIDKLVKYIRECASKNIFNKDSLVKIFNDNGIFLVIEDDLKGSKIRGAFKVLNDKPAIYITNKYKRIADIYFALLHELAHCKSDFNRAKRGSLVSLDNDNDREKYELNADKQAFNWMVDDSIYYKYKDDYEVLLNSEIKSFVVYRLAYEGVISYSSKIYQENNIIISGN